MSCCKECMAGAQRPADLQKVIYGSDDRIEVANLPHDSRAFKNAESVAIMCNANELTSIGNGKFKLTTQPFTHVAHPIIGFPIPLVSSEPFYGQPLGGSCTGFLVEPDVLVTAGHCLDSTNFLTRRFVFGFRMENGAAVTEFSEDQIYEPTELLRHALDDNTLSDFAVVRLNKRVTGREPLQVRLPGEGQLDVGAGLYVIGHPVGLPAKFAGNAFVKSWSPDGVFFNANLDTYGGNSGSPVFNAVTHKVEGILVRGTTDFKTSGFSARSNRIPDDSEGEGVTSILHALPPRASMVSEVEHVHPQARKFKMFVHPRFLDDFKEPEIVTLVPENHGPIQDGPSDNQLVVIDVDENYVLFGNSSFEIRDPVPVDQFETVAPDTHQFSACQMFATVRRVIDIAERFLGHPIVFPADADGILVLIPRVTKWIRRFLPEPFNNAVSLNGTTDEKLVFGFADAAMTKPYCENFDVLAHEAGHTIVTAVMGRVDQNDLVKYKEYRGFSECMGDIIACITSLFFDGFVDTLLSVTKGNLATENYLTRLGETSNTREIRNLLHNLKKSDVSPDKEHDYSLPLSAGIMDAFLMVYFAMLKEDQAMAPEVLDRAFNQRVKDDGNPQTVYGTEFEEAFPRIRGLFMEKLLDAREVLGTAIFKMLQHFRGNHADFNYASIARQICEHMSAHPLTPVSKPTLQNLFAAREILSTPHSLVSIAARPQESDIRVAIHEDEKYEQNPKEEEK